jgi:hypothetical protein
VGLLVTELPEALVAHNVVGPKMLKLSSICSGGLGQGHQLTSTIKAAIVIGGNVSDEIGGRSGVYFPTVDFHTGLLLECAV